jgi:hypothetical protein
MASPSPREVAVNPEWIPHTYDPTGANLTFVHVPQAARTTLTFLSDEHFAGDLAKATFPAAAVAAEAISAVPAPIHFIFHTSFCASTLLARALEIPGVSNTLREPDVLVNLANRFTQSDDIANRQRLELVLRLLERPSAPGESVIVKPTNFANRLLDPVLTLRPQSRAVLLYSDLESFLRSLLRRGMFGRIFGRNLFAQADSWSRMSFGYTQSELLLQTDAQIAALAWLMQIDHFDQIAQKFGPQRVMVLDSARLLANRAAAIKDVQALFGLRLSADQVDQIASGPVFTKHSKISDRDYDSIARKEEHKAASEAHADEITMVVQWTEAVATQMGVRMRPPS